ncbi:putative intramolecular chaperone auto-processing domain-containing protein [Plasmopara halstedii]
MTSDRRLKRNIQSFLYDWIESENRPGQEVGLIAQDLVSAHLTDLISVFYRDDIQEGEDPSFEPAKTQLNVDYSRIAAYNMKMIQHLLDRIEELEAKRKDKKYDAVFDDGRVVSFGGIKRNGEPYQQYRDITPLRAFSKYDHGNIERKQRFYRRHGPIDTSKPYTASWFSKTFLW